MNYLAHAYLSFNHPDILVGNMISDFVKGKKQFDYPLPIQKGIQLHRAIDGFTDQHPATKEGKHYFKPAVGLYAGAFMDIVYDHFLALDTRELTASASKDFSAQVYLHLSAQAHLLPENFARILPFMTTHDWLYNYRFTRGIEHSFGGLVKRARYLTDASPVFALFTKHYSELRQQYDVFFPEVKKFAGAQFEELVR
ncbi:MAG: ACP phosphodiesterase [Chitinophagaceae bacterium]|nr:ACP phosphodiesterase [Chitinophagaceae bacterium]MDP1762972.1 ACP phosphodiesterase [Sediminibacterium sp.]MDP1811846.1 ACP phosphodiesterase [Sediminibacterium sp.]MDP3127623.1 ACP phosphodiesterase [Sediminibacterium sp.]MDP3667690.1 ACP phosphodiesterase [Sediminibacterium sp.]